MLSLCEGNEIRLFYFFVKDLPKAVSDYKIPSYEIPAYREKTSVPTCKIAGVNLFGCSSVLADKKATRFDRLVARKVDDAKYYLLLGAS